MTSTTTAGQGTGHDSPCFCDRCWPAAVEDLIYERAKILDAALLDHLYTDGYERQLAEELIAGIPVSNRAEMLEYMVEWDHLHPRVMSVDCLLDECDQRSYDAVTSMAAILLNAIHDQGCEGRALRVLVENAICHEQRLLDHRRRYGW